MKRERRYRVWDVMQKKMLYEKFALIPTSSGSSWSASRLYGVDNKKLQNLLRDFHTRKDSPAHDWGDYDLVDWTDFTEFIVMDYLGRDDVDDKPIFEGDILYVEYEASKFLNEIVPTIRKWQHVVEWVDGKGLDIPNIEHHFRCAMANYAMNKDKPTPKWKIIGNIHEDADLLKKETKK